MIRDQQNGNLIARKLIYSPLVTGLEGDYLICDPSNRKKQVANAAMFSGFLDLAEAPPESILKYAKQWGVLSTPQKEIRDAFKGKLPSGFSFESVQKWKDTAAVFRAILNIGASLASGKPGLAADWNVLRIGVDEAFRVGKDPVPGRPVIVTKEKATALKDAHNHLGSEMHKLVVDAKLHPFLEWNSSLGGWRIEYNCGTPYSNLLAILILWLMLEVSQQDFAVCSFCNKTFSVEGRMPPVSQNRCCGDPECVKKRARGYERRRSAKKPKK